MRKINVFLYNNKKEDELVASGYYSYNHLTVFPGSTMVVNDKLTKSHCINKKKEILQKKQAFLKNGKYIISEEIDFTSPSLAAAVLLGKETSGTKIWKSETGKTILELNDSGIPNQKLHFNEDKLIVAAKQNQNDRVNLIATILKEKHFTYYKSGVFLYSFTNNKDADDLIKDIETQPEAFFIACIMDRSIPAERAWNIPYKIKKLLKTIKISDLIQYSQDFWIELFEKHKIHRYNKTMASVLYNAIKKIHIDYKNNPSNIWNSVKNSGVVVKRFQEFDGVGEKISTMAVNILYRDFKIPFDDLRSIDISPDVHVMRVWNRLGLIHSRINKSEVISRAQEMNPEFPGIFDISTWEIGRNYCHESYPDCNGCPLNEHCEYVKGI